jgi:hypothetical protein
MDRRLVGLLTLGIVVMAAPQALAQPRGWNGRGVAAFSLGYQATTNDFTQTVTFEELVEDATIDTDYRVEGAPTFDASLAVRIWHNLGAGVAISFYAKDQTADVDAQIPHPFFFNRFRNVSGESGPLERTETGVHVQAVYMLPLSERLQVLLSAGPSFFDVSQDLVTRVSYTHAFPFDTAAFDTATSDNDSGSSVGFNAGADVTWKFSRAVGVGGGFRYARAEVDLTAGDGNDVTVDAGGFQALGGIRFAF